MPVKGIRVAGRNTQGVKLVNLDEKDLVMAVARVVPEEEARRATPRAKQTLSARQSPPRSRQLDNG
jgi:hypothetical protein